jgi:hypothetical protein
VERKLNGDARKIMNGTQSFIAERLLALIALHAASTGSTGILMVGYIS